MSSKTVDLYVMSVLKVMFKVIFDNIIFFYQNWTHKYQGLHICKKKKIRCAETAFLCKFCLHKWCKLNQLIYFHIKIRMTWASIELINSIICLVDEKFLFSHKNWEIMIFMFVMQLMKKNC